MKRPSKRRNHSPGSSMAPFKQYPSLLGGDRIRVLIADDHMTVRAGVSSIIGMQPDMEVAAEAENGRRAVELWHEHTPDVTLLDLRMPVLDGVGVINEICAVQPRPNL